MSINPTVASKKSPIAVLLLCMFLGGMGIHRFYVGKIGTGLLMLITFGGLGIWSLIDFALIISNTFTDSKGNIIELMKNPPRFKTTLAVMFVLFIITTALYIVLASSDPTIEMQDLKIQNGTHFKNE